MVIIISYYYYYYSDNIKNLILLQILLFLNKSKLQTLFYANCILYFVLFIIDILFHVFVLCLQIMMVLFLLFECLKPSNFSQAPNENQRCDSAQQITDLRSLFG